MVKQLDRSGGAAAGGREFEAEVEVGARGDARRRWRMMDDASRMAVWLGGGRPLE